MKRQDEYMRQRGLWVNAVVVASFTDELHDAAAAGSALHLLAEDGGAGQGAGRDERVQQLGGRRAASSSSSGGGAGESSMQFSTRPASVEPGFMGTWQQQSTDSNLLFRMSQQVSDAP